MRFLSKILKEICGFFLTSTDLGIIRAGGGDAENYDYTQPPPRYRHYNLKLENDEKENKIWSMIDGNSDSNYDPDKSLADGTAIYWKQYKSADDIDIAKLNSNDLLVVRLKGTTFRKHDSCEFHDEWLCLRRLGGVEDRHIISDDKSKLVVRHRNQNGDISQEQINKESIVGIVEDTYSLPENAKTFYAQITS